MPRAAARPADVTPKPAATGQTPVPAAPMRRRAAAAPAPATPSARQPTVASAPAARPAPAEKTEKAEMAEKSLKTAPVDRSEKAGKPFKDVKAERADKLDKIDKAAERTRADKPAKPRFRMVRDSFTMPEADFALIAQLKAAAVAMGRPAKKSELLRAGLRLLAAQAPKALLVTLDSLEPVKLGRPKQAG